MIQFADDSTKQEARDMWKTCFGDSDDYMDIYFKHKYRNENTLLYFKDNKPVASLQMLIYSFTFHGNEIPVAYLSGLCTLPEYRKRGYMKQLIVKSYDVAYRRGIPLMILVPQDESLLDYYDRFGFVKAFDSGKSLLPSLSKIMDESSNNMQLAYKAFDFLYRNNDMTVQKSFDDFSVIVEEAKLFNYPPKRKLIGMARVINAKQLIQMVSGKRSQPSLVISVEDELIKKNNGEFVISGGNDDWHVKVNIRELAQLLLGYYTSEKQEPLRSIFPKKEPSMHFMLE